jgi:hypothetical protein
MNELDENHNGLSVPRIVDVDALTGFSTPMPWQYAPFDLAFLHPMIRPVCSFLADLYNVLNKKLSQFLHPVMIRLV